MWHVLKPSSLLRARPKLHSTEFHLRDGVGPRQARIWTPWLDDLGMPKKEVVTKDEIICQVELKDGALTPASLGKLTLHGVPATGQPRRDATLPPRA